MNNDDRKTDRQLWEEYWQTYVPQVVIEKSAFSEVFSAQPNGAGKRFLEIGGFPGVFAVWFKKHKGYDVSLLDFYTANEVTHKLLAANDLESNAITIIESDLFNYIPLQKFDLVTSFGFIEHFKNTNLVLQKHADCTADGGKLLITLPNLCGINGWVQRTFDKANYDIHVIECMDLELLKNATINAGLKNVNVYYYGKPMVWLEPKAPVNKVVRWLVKMLSISIKLFSLQGKLMSPYIVIEAEK